MKEKLTQIIIKAVGEDRPQDEWLRKRDQDFYNLCFGYNQALADIRAKATMIAEQMLGEMRNKIINHENTFGITDTKGRGGAILVDDVLDLLK